MNPETRNRLLAMTPAQRAREASNARKALRLAWPHRRDETGTPDLRAHIVIESNVAALRDLRMLAQ